MMKLHFAFSEWDDNNVEVFRTLDDGASLNEVFDVFKHFISMAYGYDVKISPEETQLSFNFGDNE